MRTLGAGLNAILATSLVALLACREEPAPASAAPTLPSSPPASAPAVTERGNAIARPKRYRGKPLPRGDCGKNLHWLRHRLVCEGGVCVSRNVGDMC
jgi:hypothetical protein